MRIIEISGQKANGGTVRRMAVATWPDGQTLAIADDQGVIHLLDAATRREKVGSARSWQIGRIGALVFSPDGFTCIAGGEGGRIVVWDLEPADLAQQGGRQR